MKMRFLTKVGSVVLYFALVATAKAGLLDGLGTWQGTGAVFDSQGREAGSFTVELIRTAPDTQTVETRGSITMSTGEVIPVNQKTTVRGNGFRIESNHGTGGGACFGAGICQSYEDAGNGKAFATTIVVDAPDRLRILVTELNQGQAVRFFRQSLTLTKKS